MSLACIWSITRCYKPPAIISIYAARLLHHLRRSRRLRQDHPAPPPGHMPLRPQATTSSPSASPAEPPSATASAPSSSTPAPKPPSVPSLPSPKWPSCSPTAPSPSPRSSSPPSTPAPSSSATATPTPPRPTRAAAASSAADRILAMHAAVCDNLQPDLTLLLLPPLESSLRRARRRNQRSIQTQGTDENRFERESDDFYRRIHAGYQQIAAREPQRVVTIDDNGTIDQIHQIILQIVAAGSPLRKYPNSIPPGSMSTIPTPTAPRITHKIPGLRHSLPFYALKPWVKLGSPSSSSSISSKPTAPSPTTASWAPPSSSSTTPTTSAKSSSTRPRPSSKSAPSAA